MNAMQFISIVLFSSFLLIPQKTFEDAPVPVEQEPHHHTVLKNDSVVVMRVTLREGERTLYHIHARDRVAVELSNCNISQQNLNEPEGPRRPPNQATSPLLQQVQRRLSIACTILGLAHLKCWTWNSCIVPSGLRAQKRRPRQGKTPAPGCTGGNWLQELPRRCTLMRGLI